MSYTPPTNRLTLSSAQQSSFGELAVSEMTPVIQLDAIYDYNDVALDEIQVLTAVGGIATISDGLFTAKCVGSTYSYGVVRSKSILRYRPGQGGMGRFTASYDADPGCQLRAGLFSQEGGLFIGIQTTGDFGVMREKGGIPELRQLSITTASSSAGIATITLNGVSTNVSLINNSGITTATAAGIVTNTFSGWTVEQKDGNILFLSTSTFPQAGTFSFNPGTTGAVGTFTTLATAQSPTENWTYQSDFNVDTLDGNGPSGMTLDPTKLNVYQIQFRWLGAGVITYSIEDQISGDLITFHKEHYVNQNTSSWVANPSFKMGYIAFNRNGVGAGGTVRGGSMLAAIEGRVVETKNTKSYSVTKTALAANSDHHLMTIRNPITFDGKINTRKIKFTSLSYAVDVGGNAFNPTEIKLTQYPQLDSSVNQQYQTISNTDIGVASTVTGTITYTTSKAVSFTSIAPPDDGSTINLIDYNLDLNPGESMSITSRCAATSGPSVAMTWVQI